jgi:DNA-binding HxlR family transcriptional regulator
MRSSSQVPIESTPGCIASAVNVLGKKWTALILRDLLDGPKHFCELERSVGKINPRTLSQRLSCLEKQAIILNRNGHYELTEKGLSLMPVIKQMADWGIKYPTPQ